MVIHTGRGLLLGSLEMSHPDDVEPRHNRERSIAVKITDSALPQPQKMQCDLALRPESVDHSTTQYQRDRMAGRI
jgi:hypothetical protein